MIEAAIKGKKSSPDIVFLIITYTLAKALSISPLEIYKMPSSMVIDLLSVHGIMEKIKHEELEKIKRRAGK
tara:strand:+ start:2157 stop:2369 length:213 start_codon:yes stop_codon:yes gene_type:complete